MHLFFYQVNIEGRPLNSETGAKSVFYGYDGELCGVEQLALQYYADEGGSWQGTHSEGGIWMTIFGLLMWDVIFSEVCDVFRSEFQVPDLCTMFFCYLHYRVYYVGASWNNYAFDNCIGSMFKSIPESHFFLLCFVSTLLHSLICVFSCRQPLLIWKQMTSTSQERAL